MANCVKLPDATVPHFTAVAVAVTDDVWRWCRQTRVQWTTGAASPAPVVQYGTSPGSYTNSTAGVSAHGYARSELNGTTQPNYGIANGTG